MDSARRAVVALNTIRIWLSNQYTSEALTQRVPMPDGSSRPGVCIDARELTSELYRLRLIGLPILSADHLAVDVLRKIGWIDDYAVEDPPDSGELRRLIVIFDTVNTDPQIVAPAAPPPPAAPATEGRGASRRRKKIGRDPRKLSEPWEKFIVAELSKSPRLKASDIAEQANARFQGLRIEEKDVEAIRRLLDRRRRAKPAGIPGQNSPDKTS